MVDIRREKVNLLLLLLILLLPLLLLLILALENVECFNCMVSLITHDARYTLKLNPELP